MPVVPGNFGNLDAAVKTARGVRRHKRDGNGDLEYSEGEPVVEETFGRSTAIYKTEVPTAARPANVLVVRDGKIQVPDVDFTWVGDDIDWGRRPIRPRNNVAVLDASDMSTFWAWSAEKGQLA